MRNKITILLYACTVNVQLYSCIVSLASNLFTSPIIEPEQFSFHRIGSMLHCNMPSIMYSHIQ